MRGRVDVHSFSADLAVVLAVAAVTALAIHRGQDGVTLPTGHEPLRPGDKLALIGTNDALARAELLLREGLEALTAEDAPDKPLLSQAPPE